MHHCDAKDHEFWCNFVTLREGGRLALALDTNCCHFLLWKPLSMLVQCIFKFSVPHSCPWHILVFLCWKANKILAEHWLMLHDTCTYFYTLTKKIATCRFIVVHGHENPGCGALNPANVVISYSNGFSVGSTATVVCDSENGYVHREGDTDSTTRTCTMDGWSGSKVSCESKWVSLSWSAVREC